MLKETKYSRLILKRSDVTTLSATTAPSTDHTVLPAWQTTDVYVGEMFLNSADNKLWIRTTNNIKEIPLIDSGDFSLNVFTDVSITSPTDGQVLTFSGGTWYNKNPQFEGTGITYATVSPLSFSSPLMSASLLNQIQDVDIKDPQLEQFLVFVGDRWTNKTKIDKIESLAWDKAESKLIINTAEGTFKLSMQGKPIHTIVEDVELDNTFHTIIVDASAHDINILLPPTHFFYGDMFNIKVINYTYNTTIYPAESEFIYTDSLLTELIISEDSTVKSITLHCDGNST